MVVAVAVTSITMPTPVCTIWLTIEGPARAEPDTDLDLLEKDKHGSYATELLNSNHIELTPEELEVLESRLDQMPLDKATKVSRACQDYLFVIPALA
jgi:hypothetical protein